MGINSLYQPMTISGENIDSRYFIDLGDGTYRATPLFIHNVARDLVNFTKKRIFELDDGNLYHSESLREVKDTWAEKMHDTQWKLKYGDKIAEANKRWYKYRNEHPDEFEVKFKRVSIGGEDEARFFAGYSPDIKPGLNDTVKLYNAARELAARFAAPDKDGNAGPEYDTLPFEEPLYSKAEFIEAHKAVRTKISEELGIPEDNFEVGKVEKLVPRINNKKCTVVGSDDTQMDEFVSGLISHLTSSTTAEFKKNYEECVTLINRDFILNFNDSTKSLKAEPSDNDSIVIWTKPTDTTNSVKIITIGKDDPFDTTYKYNFSITTDNETLRYNKVISTKADLRKALENTKMMIEDIPNFKCYVEDIQAQIDTL